MDPYRKSVRFGIWAILCAGLLRLAAGGFFQSVFQWLNQPDIQSFLIYLETGRNVRFSPSLEEKSNFAGESAPPVFPDTAALPCFTAADVNLLDMTYSCGLRPDLQTLLCRPLNWNLSDSEPTVLIVHTHTTESYTKSGEKYAESAKFRTLDEAYNMISVGDRVAERLEAGGIRVIHDRTLHDYPSYNGSYSHARKSIRRYLEEYPTIRLVLDLHRDASGDLNNQLRTLATVDGEASAQLMLVMGTSAAGLSHPHWQENLSLGLKLHAQLERIAPGITRPIDLRAQRFNQDMTTGSLLIEVGAAGNTHREAIRAAEVLAEAILSIANGTTEG